VAEQPAVRVGQVWEQQSGDLKGRRLKVLWTERMRDRIAREVRQQVLTAGGYIHFDAHRDWPETPTTGMCCMGSAARGPSSCTCWEPVYDVEQAAPRTDGLLFGCRSSMCKDCAYRPGSPERRGDEEAAGDQELLDDLVVRGQPFWCHQGMRRPVRYRHPSGVVVAASPLEYAPPQSGGRLFKADGSPADLCFGWAARRARFVQWEAAGA
jgi:hypothetical protein